MTEPTNKTGGGRGGARKGAGRPPGAASAKTRAIADAAAKAGVTPLEVMLLAMSTCLAAAKRTKGDKRRELMAQAAAHAKDAAPFMHPRLAAVDHTQGGGKDLPAPVPTAPAPVINVTVRTEK